MKLLQSRVAKGTKQHSEFLTEHAKRSCLLDCLYSVLDAQFGEDVADMTFDRIDGNDQFLGNFLVGCAACQQLQDLQFSLTQGLRQWLSFGEFSHVCMHHTFLLKDAKQHVQIK